MPSRVWIKGERESLAMEVNFYNFLKILYFYYLFSDMKCHAKPRDDDKMLCSDGTLGSQWNGCYKNDQVRVQCPSGYSPCNALRGKSNGKEFVCSDGDCEKLGGKRYCEGTMIDL